MQELIKLDFVDLAIAVGLMAIAIGLFICLGKIRTRVKFSPCYWENHLTTTCIGIHFRFHFGFGQCLGSFGDINNNADNYGDCRTKSHYSKNSLCVAFGVVGAILISTALTVLYTNFLIIQPERWYEPQYIIPLVGIVLGNATNAAALAGDRLVSTINSSHLEIETHLSLGATPQQAVSQISQRCHQSRIDSDSQSNAPHRYSSNTRNYHRTVVIWCETFGCCILRNFDYVYWWLLLTC